MGVRGLMTYINRNCDLRQSYELHNGYVVIDGNSLAIQLYLQSNCNCIFGGDYDVYAHAVGEFFDDFAGCEVVPLVVLDGGMEHKKLKTSYNRMLEKLHSAANYTPKTPAKFIPMAIMLVFENVLRQKEVKFARCIFEADPAIAGIAQVLNCPVLSYDSDFYIFEGMYIPLKTLEPGVFQTSKGNGYMKRCQLFKTEHLLDSLPGLDPSVLPLAAVLLGNDYVKSIVFKDFFNYLRVTNGSPQRGYEEQIRIHETLSWLCNYNLNDAVAAVLSTLPKMLRRKALVTIEVIINRYLVLPIDILVPLGLSDKYSIELERRSPFQFEGDIDTLDLRQFWPYVQVFTNVNSSSYDQTRQYMNFVVDNNKDACNEDFAKTWPSWFAKCYSMGDFPSYFINMMYLGLCMIPTQIEDFRYPSAYIVSLEIVEVIYGLLVAGSNKLVPHLSYQVRDKLDFTTLDQNGPPVQGTSSTKFPPLADLRTTPMKIRKRIIDDTLKITGMEPFFENIPEKWKLYLATISYWMVTDKLPKNVKMLQFQKMPGQSDKLPKNSCHLNAVLFAMLLGVIDDKVGYQRSLKEFNKVHSESLAKIELVRNNNSKAVDSQNQENSIIKALNAVTKEDCFAAVPFIIHNCTMDEQIVAHPETFDVTIVHAFAQFQSCLQHAIYLNVLLGYPYENPIIAQMYNGTMLYNLYTKLKKDEDVAAYISVALENSLSLQNLMRFLIARVMTILDKITIDDNN